jgi:hypothetical protein
MTAVCVTIILFAPEGFSLPGGISYTTGIAVYPYIAGRISFIQTKLGKGSAGFG